jgi:DNA-binding SARP family transcriptional activator
MNGEPRGWRDPGGGASLRDDFLPWLDADGPADELLFEPLLPGWSDRWVVLERERLAQWQLHRLDQVIDDLLTAEEHLGAADVQRAIDLALRLVGLDPLRERSQAALIRAYAAEGSFGHARRQYDQYRALLEQVTGQPCRLTYEDIAARPAPAPPASAAAPPASGPSSDASRAASGPATAS